MKMKAFNFSVIQTAIYLCALLLSANNVSHAQNLEKYRESSDFNKVKYFLADYENALNKDSINSSDYILSYFYNPNVEVYNDFSTSYLDDRYITAKKYSDKIEDSEIRYFYFHSDLEIVKIDNRGYYDIIIAKVKQDKYSCPFQIIEDTGEKFYQFDSIKDDNHSENYLTFNFLYYKYKNERNFKILKIEKSGESMLPAAWFKMVLPDEIRIEYSSFLTSLKSDNTLNYEKTLKPGFGVNLLIENRISGGRFHSFSGFAGVGYMKMNNQWKIKDYYLEIQDTDIDDQEYTKMITGSNIEQEVSYSLVKIPLGLSVRVFPISRLNFSLNAGVDLWFLNRSNLTVNNGDFSYVGKYSIQGHDFLISDIKEPYGFGNYNATEKKELSLSEFGYSFNLSGYVGFKLTNNFDLFFGPQYNMVKFSKDNNASNTLSFEKGKTASIAEVVSNTTFSNTGFNFGARFRLNNIDKPFIKPIVFKNSAHKEGKQSYFDSFKVETGETMLDSSNKKRKFRILIDADTGEKGSVRKISYYIYREKTLKDGSTESKLSFGKLSVNKQKKITLKKNQKLYIVKPFGYDISSDNYTNARDFEMRVDTIQSLNQSFELKKLDPLHVYITSRAKSGMDNETFVRQKLAMTEMFLKDIGSKGKHECIHYVYGDRIGQDFNSLFTEGKNSYCLPCSIVYDSLKYSAEIDKENNTGSEIFPSDAYQGEGSGTENHFLTELRTRFNNDFLVGRRLINLHVYMWDSSDFNVFFNELFKSTQPLTLSNDELTSNDVKEYYNYILAHPLEIDQFESIYFYSNFNSLLSKINPDLIIEADTDLSKMLFLSMFINSKVTKEQANKEKINTIQTRNFIFKNIIY